MSYSNTVRNHEISTPPPGFVSRWFWCLNMLATATLAMGLLAADPQVLPEPAPVAIALADTWESALREQVTTELVQRYNCCVLNRMRGLILRSEQQLGDLTTIDQLRKSTGGIRAGDYTVSINQPKNVG